MNPQEVLYRIRVALMSKAQSARVNLGWTPVPDGPVTPKVSLFDESLDWLATWKHFYRPEEAAIDDLLRGKMSFFGHSSLDILSPVNWHRDPLTGVEAPLVFGKELNYRNDRLVGNVKVLWELGRHQHLVPLAITYAVTGDLRYRTAVTSQIESWIDANPFGLGIHWCSSLEVALRLISWSVVQSLVALRDGSAGLFTDSKFAEKLGTSIFQQAWFIRGFFSRHSSANNHLIGELTGLWVACQVFDLGDRGERWAGLAREQLEVEASSQVFRDGVDKEQSCYYHLWVLEYLMFAELVGRRSGLRFSPEFSDRIRKMADFLRTVSADVGVPPQIGDADDGFVTRFTLAWPENAFYEVVAAVDEILATTANKQTLTTQAVEPSGSANVGESSPPLTDSQDQVTAIFNGTHTDFGATLPQKVFWYSLCAGKVPSIQSESARVSSRRSFPVTYPESGYAVMRDGALTVVFDAGSLGYPSIAAHGHSDALSVCVAVQDRWWLVDPGTYSYHSDGGWRDYFRGTSAHNTLEIDGVNQSLIGGPFLWLRHANARLLDVASGEGRRQWATGEHDGYRERGANHRRTVELDGELNRLRIVDEVDGSGEHKLALHFHFAPEIALVPGSESGTWLASRSDSDQLMSVYVNSSWNWKIYSGSDDPKLGWYSPVLGVRYPSPTLRGETMVSLPVKIVTELILG